MPRLSFNCRFLSNGIDENRYSDSKEAMSSNDNDAEIKDASPAAVESENSGADETVSPKRSRTPIYIVGAFIALFLTAGLSWWFYSRRFEKTDNASIQGNISLIRPQISSHIKKILVKENQFVKQGDLLIEFDAREAEANFEKAQASLRIATAKKSKVVADYDLTRKTTRADLTQASSNLSSAQNNVEQTRLAADSKLNSVEQAKNHTQTAEANLRQVEAQAPAAQAALEHTKAQVPAAQARLDDALTEYQRSQELFNHGDISKQDLERDNRLLSDARANNISAQKQVAIAQAQLNTLLRQVEVEKSRLNEAKTDILAAENNYRQSLSQIDIATSQVGESQGKVLSADVLPEQTAIRESEIQTIEAEVAQSQAALGQAALELSYTKIYAPQDGYVSKQAAVEGDLVEPNQALMSIALPGIWIIANFKETQIERIKPGQSVNIYVDAYPSKTFRGKVDSFQPGTGSRFSVLPSENASGNFVKVVQRIQVKIVFDNLPEEKYLLVPGMSVVPQIIVE
jgi:membrane fusion protein (multidrug efflux system)